MTVLVTGAYGFLGSRLVEKLSKQHQVIGVYNSSVSNAGTEGVNYINNIDTVSETPDVIIMCHAAVSSGNHKANNRLLYNANVDFTEKVYQKFSTSRIVYISSVSVFGIDAAVVTENSTSKPETEYAISKLWGEKVVMQNKANCVLRISSLYGEGMKENTLIPNYCKQALTDKVIQVWGDGSRAQNYIHVDDVVSLVEKLMTYEAPINFPLLGVSSSEYTNAEVAGIIANLTGAQIEYVNNDNSISFNYNNELTREVLNWQSFLSLSNGLKDFIEWKRK